MKAKVDGVARVMGSLALSRAFGDLYLKRTGGLWLLRVMLELHSASGCLCMMTGPDQRDHPVTCAPQLQAGYTPGN